jgi:hypothetical protein
MSADDSGGGGLFGPVLSMQRAVVESGLELQRQAAERTLDRIEAFEGFSRRTRLSSHYSAVRVVDGLEAAHPADDPNLDPLYDGVGRTFEVLTDLDDRATDTAADAVSATRDATERVGEEYLALSESTCDPLTEVLDGPDAGTDIDVTVDAPADD